MQDWTRSCWLCGRNGADDPLDRHHIFEGWANKANSERWDVTVCLCHNRCHIFGRDAAHNSKATADRLHRYGQRQIMLREGWTVEDFRRVFGRNYLDEDEIEEIYAEQRGETGVQYSDDDFQVVEDEALPEWLCA